MTCSSRRAVVRLVLSLVLPVVLTGCLYDAILGKGQSTLGIGTEHPCDGVLVAMLRAIEERRPEQFSQHIDIAANPGKDQLWLALTNFLNRADAIEYVITVERRHVDGININYVFSWTRKFEEKSTGQVVTASGRAEWSFIENLGAYSLISATGPPLF